MFFEGMTNKLRPSLSPPVRKQMLQKDGKLWKVTELDVDTLANNKIGRDTLYTTFIKT